MSTESFANADDMVREQLSWLDAPFIAECLQRNNEQQIDVIRFDVAPVTKKGENYCSDLYRVSIEFSKTFRCNNDAVHSSTDHCNVIVKAALGGDVGFHAMIEVNAYEKEMEMYELILPRLKVLLHNAGIEQQMFADTIFVHKPQKAILFEDLSVKQYRTNCSKDGFDLIHTHAILSKLAEFHAAAAVLQEQQPNIYAKFKHGMINRNAPTFDSIQLTLLDAVIESIVDWPDAVYYAEKLRKLRSVLIEMECKAFDAIDGHFNTLIHGDMWFSNIMLRYNGECVDNITLIDFQYNCWTSPTMDLQYFFNTSLQEPLRLHHQNDLLQFYHEKLVNALKRLNYRQTVPTLDALREQFLARSIWGFASACLIQPLFMNEHTEHAGFDVLLGNNEKSKQFKRTVVENPKVQNNLRQLLPIYDKLGIF